MSTLRLSSRFGRTVGCGMLSWKSEKTLAATLESHSRHGLFELFDRTLIHLQEVRPQDEELARRFGLEWIGSESNRHIGGGFYRLIQALDTDYLFLLEDDLTLDKDATALYQALSDAIYLMEQDEIDLFRCRRRGNLQKSYTKYHRIRTFDDEVNDIDPGYFDSVSELARLWNRVRRPFHAARTIGKAPWVEKHPEAVFPRYIRCVPGLYGDVYVLTGKATKWSNPAICARRARLLKIYDYIGSQTPGFEDFGLSLEKLVNKRHRKWWLRQNFRLGVTKEILIDHSRHADGGKLNPSYVRVE